MGRKNQKRLTAAILAVLLLPVLSASAQNGSGQQDSLVRLVKATSLQLIEKGTEKFRKAVDATFLHNGTYLICDTALWNVDKQVINSEGHVQIIQDETLLTSDRLDYYIDRDLAEFRGGVVQLTDKDGNILRTRNLDYNTKDSVAVFRRGASMRDKDGQIIESENGSYDSKSSLFTFLDRVNMFTDSVFVKTEHLVYEGNTSRADFKTDIDFWKDGNMLSAQRGWYDRGNELFFFTGAVHGLSKEQESWSDSLYFHRNSMDVELLGNAQIQDTTRNVSAVAQRIFYEDSLSRVTLTRKAAVAMRTEQEGQAPDTLFFGADTLILRTIPKCDIPEDEILAAEERLKDMNTDPVREYRTKAAREAAEAAKNQMEALGEGMMGDRGPAAARKPLAGKNPEMPVPEASDSLGMPSVSGPGSADSLGLAAVPADSLAGMPAAGDSLAVADSLAMLPPPDTTKIEFLEGRGSVKIFRQDIQVRCDSMRYNSLDSIARFYLDPVVWNDGNRQYSSDSLFVLVRNSAADRANLLSDAFIIIQEDTVCFDQIKATEVIAYFDSTAALKRFDALGGASALFYLKENDVFATVNKVESKMLSGWFKDGEIDRVYYFDQPKNDAYPVVQLPADERQMKGFNWRIGERPSGPWDITDLRVRKSQRKYFESRPKATFRETDIYFPGYIGSVYRSIAVRDSLKALPRQSPAPAAEGSPEGLLAETDASPGADAGQNADSPKEGGSEAGNQEKQPESGADSLRTVSHVDSLGAAPKTPREIKAAERKAKAEAARAAREARWAELDARDEARAQAKAAKAQARARAAKRRILEAQAAQLERDNAKLERFKRRYEKQKARKEARAARKAARAALKKPVLPDKPIEETQ
ncbi:MAG: OstA-like protein [Candidatus Cryptobacteroides sp.]|nr:OstA-like protein [Candidatus Cryptobacteroides sp.]